MKSTFGIKLLFVFATLAVFTSRSFSNTDSKGFIYPDEEPQTLNVLFIGNSFTQRNSLPEVVKTVFEQGNPNITFNWTWNCYGGRNLQEHWKLGTQNFIKQFTLTATEEQEMIASIEAEIDRNPTAELTAYYKLALPRHRELLTAINNKQVKKWDMVVLQSWQDDRFGESSLYLQYAPMFATIAKAQGARVILYETTPTTQNAYPLTAPPTNRTFVIDKEKYIAALGRQLNADVVPMALTAYNCQLTRPDFTMRYITDFHPNQTMTYLTACTFFAAICNRSPQGLPLDRVKANKYLDEDHKDLDQNGDPIVKIFSATDKADLQRIAWESINEFKDTFVGFEGTKAGQGVIVFPNPANETLKIFLLENLSNRLLEVKLLSLDGKLLYSETNFKQEGEGLSINISSLPSAVYILSGETLKGTFAKEVFINN